MYEYVCPDCGARLDPEEKCDCKNEQKGGNEACLSVKNADIFLKKGKKK